MPISLEEGAFIVSDIALENGFFFFLFFSFHFLLMPLRMV